MPLCKIEGCPYTIDNAIITDYTDAPVAGVTSVEFLKVVGTYDKATSHMSGNKMIEVTKTYNFQKIVNPHMIELFLNNETDILTFSVPGETTIKEINKEVHRVDIEVENGTDLTTLTPTITTSKESTISPLSGVAQNFTTPVTYTVTAEDGTIQNWIVTVIEALA